MSKLQMTCHQLIINYVTVVLYSFMKFDKAGNMDRV